jgi:hypothetical protein
VEQLVDITGVEVVAEHTLFAKVRVDPESGTVAWPNGVDLAPEPLYEEARRNPATPASAHRGV